MIDYSISTGETTLFCKVSGSGEPLLLLHGNEEDHTIFEHQIPFLSKFYQVIALDSRGHGRSDHGEECLTFQRMAEDVVTVLDYFELEKTNIIGFSDGGNLGLYVASHFPIRVDNLIVVGANYKPKGLKTKEFLYVKGLFYYLKVNGYISKAKQKRMEIIDLMWHQLKLNEKDLKNITARTLVVVGENDVIKKKHSEVMHTLLLKSTIITIPEATHFLMIEKPDVFNSIVRDFLLKK